MGVRQDRKYVMMIAVDISRDLGAGLPDLHYPPVRGFDLRC
jgi:hypothetical protein